MLNTVQAVNEPDIELAIKGMTCASCVRRIEKVLLKVPGVNAATVNLATERAKIAIMPTTVTVVQLTQAIESAGYSATPVSRDEPEEKDKDLRKDRRHLIIAALLALPLVMPMLLEPLGFHWMPPGWAQLLLTVPIQFWFGARFYRAAWKAIKARSMAFSSVSVVANALLLRGWQPFSQIQTSVTKVASET